MANGTTLPDFGSYLLQNFIADVKADMAPDAVAILQVVANGGFQALLDPQNNVMVMSYLVKLQADAMATGSDLSKQVATYVILWLQNKFASQFKKVAA